MRVIPKFPSRQPFWKQPWLRNRRKVEEFTGRLLRSKLLSEPVFRAVWGGPAEKRRAWQPSVQQQLALADIMRQRRNGSKIEPRDMIAAGEYCQGFRQSKGPQGRRISARDFKKISEKKFSKDWEISERPRVNGSGKFVLRMSTKAYGMVWVEYHLAEDGRVDRQSMEFGLVRNGTNAYSFYSEHEENAREQLARAIDFAMGFGKEPDAKS